MKISNRSFFFSAIIAALLLSGCNKVLDKKDLTAVDVNAVWNDAKLANAYVNNIYNDLMPGMPQGDGGTSDEAMDAGGLGIPTDLLRGTATIDAYNNWPYDKIRKINIGLENIDKGSTDDNTKAQIKGQLLFWRAWVYFSMVRGYGGVPLVLNVQNADEGEALFVTRNKTSECITQILADLDNAISLLPDAWPDETGRIDKGASMAFKGKVLLYWASPQFNPTGLTDRWQAAYEANDAAVKYLTGMGKGLYEDYSKIWDNEGNKEIVMVRRYTNPEAAYTQAGIRPILFSSGDANKDMPSLNLVNAFPMKNGAPFNPAVDGYDTLFRNRDDRFYATIAYNGADMKLADMIAAKTYIWTYWYPSGGSASGVPPTQTSFYREKGLDKDITVNTRDQADVDWPEIRFAEVLMNYGEAANETGKSGEALDVLYQIRARAKILPGADSHYGVTAVSKEQIRNAYLSERQVEFAFEGKRWWDLRRCRRFDILNTIKRRSGLHITLKNGETGPAGQTDINTVYNRFTYPVTEIDHTDMNVKDEYYFYGIPKEHLDKNSNLQQTKGWNSGTFDPLQ